MTTLAAQHDTVLSRSAAFDRGVWLRDLRIADGASAYGFLLSVMLVDAWLLFRFFTAGPRLDMAQAVSPH